MKMLSLNKLFIAGALLFAAIIAPNGLAQHARSSRASSIPSAGNSAITCQPGFVFRCNSHGCFCVKP
jgi:hypothetical protein